MCGFAEVQALHWVDRTRICKNSVSAFSCTFYGQFRVFCLCVLIVVVLFRLHNGSWVIITILMFPHFFVVVFFCCAVTSAVKRFFAPFMWSIHLDCSLCSSYAILSLDPALAYKYYRTGMFRNIKAGTAPKVFIYLHMCSLLLHLISIPSFACNNLKKIIWWTE